MRLVINAVDGIDRVVFLCSSFRNYLGSTVGKQCLLAVSVGGGGGRQYGLMSVLSGSVCGGKCPQLAPQRVRPSILHPHPQPRASTDEQIHSHTPPVVSSGAQSEALISDKLTTKHDLIDALAQPSMQSALAGDPN